MCTACKPLNGTGPGHTVNEKESEEGQEQRADRAILAPDRGVFSFNVYFVFNFWIALFVNKVRI